MKQKLYDKLVALGRKQAKAESTVPVVAPVPTDASEETKLVHKIKTEEAKKQKATVQQLDQDYQTLPNGKKNIRAMPLSLNPVPG